MTAIYTETPLEFEGKQYQVKADFRFINRVEQRGINLLTLLTLAAQGVTPKTSDLAWVVYAALTGCGENVDFNDVGDVVRTNMKYYMQFVSDVAEAAYATPAVEGNSKADDKDEDAKKKP